MKNKEIKITNLKDKVVFMAKTLDFNYEQTTFGYFENLMNNRFSGDSDLPLIKEKMDNLMTLLNETKQKSEEEFAKILAMDFEDELYYMI